MQKLKVLAVITIGLSLFVIFIVILATESGNKASPGSAPVANSEEMNLSIRETTMQQAAGFGTGKMIAIKNLNSFDWKDCSFTLNETYKAHLDFIDMPSELKGSITDTKDSMLINETEFVNSSGIKFNPYLQVPVKILVECQQPKHDFYVSAWR